ncbi:MAG TPA: hypothetical protein PLO37_20235 [Candidatus Hydrogenedentes bacterium]|nr:hypothetical protein [Candidatus Hydrogenedentota bacterium]HPG69183.1 hypothetical protein [Candidatus Hydrogenedentota bacterium]
MTILSVGRVVAEDAPMFSESVDLLDDVPAGFPRFHFAGHEEDAQWLSRYLWYHFKNRGGAGTTVFNQEYLTTSDLWMADAKHPNMPAVIQTVHRADLIAIPLDKEGYVSTQQHFSHAHEHGWPFPMWTQTLTGEEGFAAGWHFQDDGPGWVWDSLRRMPHTRWARKEAIEGWGLDNVRSLGIAENKWQLEATGESPTLITPEYARIDAFCAPFLQLRWTRTPEPPKDVLPYVEWMREGDEAFSPERRVYFGFDNGNPGYEGVSGTTHSMIAMYPHPLWKGFIKRLRIGLAPGETNVTFAIDSFFTVYDTRHTINNPIYIMACWDYFRWTGDICFLEAAINSMRLALRYQQTTMGGLELNRIRDQWIGHDGLPGYSVNADGTKSMHYGHGIGSNYWDLLPFGWDDMYATAQYYAATLAMAAVEQAIIENPGWGVPRGGLALDPQALRAHAAAVKETANRLFWSPDTGRFIACIDTEGGRHDYGFTFLNLDAIWYGIASDEHAESIMAWISGARVVDGDTSTGEDIYHWRFGPRATTLRNVEWYGHGWTSPESIPWGGQVQDGGAVLGFSFYDLWAHLHVLDADAAWHRLQALLEWERDVWAEGGYRKYYEGGRHGTTLQGGGTAGGIGVDCEFYESSLVPSIVIHGFLGLDPGATTLAIRPRLPKACPEMGVSGVLYRDVRLDVRAGDGFIEIALKNRPRDPICVSFAEACTRVDTGEKAAAFTLSDPQVYRFQQ